MASYVKRAPTPDTTNVFNGHIITEAAISCIHENMKDTVYVHAYVNRQIAWVDKNFLLSRLFLSSISTWFFFFNAILAVVLGIKWEREWRIPCSSVSVHERGVFSFCIFFILQQVMG